MSAERDDVALSSADLHPPHLSSGFSNIL